MPSSKKEVRDALDGIISGERPRNLKTVQQWLDSPKAQSAAEMLRDGLNTGKGRIYPRLEPHPLYPFGALPPL